MNGGLQPASVLAEMACYRGVIGRCDTSVQDNQRDDKNIEYGHSGKHSGDHGACDHAKGKLKKGRPTMKRSLLWRIASKVWPELFELEEALSQSEVNRQDLERLKRLTLNGEFQWFYRKNANGDDNGFPD